jgi:hypothetical protein
VFRDRALKYRFVGPGPDTWVDGHIVGCEETWTAAAEYIEDNLDEGDKQEGRINGLF